jgi:ABC-type uncharacterized transport system permease subunit
LYQLEISVQLFLHKLQAHFIFASAGSHYYEKAGRYNWVTLEGLLTAGQTYIAVNLAALQANQNMPSTFATTFGTDKTAFVNLNHQFLQSEEDS